MSKLYDVISRLDEISSLEEYHQGTPDIPFQHGQSSSSLVRILVLSGALIFFGLAAVGLTAWRQGWVDRQQGILVGSSHRIEIPADVSVPAHPVSQPDVAKVDSTDRQPFIDPPPAEPTFRQSETPAIPEYKETIDQPLSLFDDTAIQETPTVIDRLPAKPGVNNYRNKVQPQPLVIDEITPEPQPLPQTEEGESFTLGDGIDQTAQQSRWLHQAEQRRKAGDWEGAVVLFAKVWQISANPAVANNLAASLIELDRLSEANAILVKALQKAPRDQDLKENLRIVQQLSQK